MARIAPAPFLGISQILTADAEGVYGKRNSPQLSDGQAKFIWDLALQASCF